MGKIRSHKQRGGGEGDGDVGASASIFSAGVLVMVGIIVSIFLSTTNNQLAVIILLSVFVVFLFIFMASSFVSVSQIKPNEFTTPYVSMFSWVLYGFVVVVGELIFITAKYKHSTIALTVGIILATVSALILTGLISTNKTDDLNTIYSAKEAPDTRLLTLSLMLVFSAATSLIVAFFPQNYISTDGGASSGGHSTYS